MGQVSVMVLLHHITQLLAQGNNSHHPLEFLLGWYYDQFEVMLGFLTYNEKTDNGRLLTDKITELAHETEDHVDELYRKYSTEQQQIPLQINHEAKLTKEIEGITNRIEELMSGSCRFEYDSRREKAVRLLKQSFPRSTRGWVTDPQADVALDNTKHSGILVDRLINGRPPKKLDLIVIRGGEETGMTPLVKKVYNDASVVDYFESRAWVFLGREYILRNLLLRVLNDVMLITDERMYDMDVWKLKWQLQKQLVDRRYLIVVENIYASHEWEKLLRDVFPVNNKGSRIIFTTHNFTASYGITNSIYEFKLGDNEYPNYSKSRKYSRFDLGYLSKKEKWEQFSKMIFGENECPEELKHLGLSIVESCDRWPFVRVIVGRILRGSAKTDLIRWSNMVARLKELGGLFYPLQEILTICYDEMPQHLKPCLLYLGLFPEGFEISVKQLIRLWIAEGRIQYSEDKQARSMEDVAEEDYLDGLIGLNFVQVTERRLDGGPKSLRIHDQVRDVCVKLSRKGNFYQAYLHSYFATLGIFTIPSDFEYFQWHISSLHFFSQETQGVSEEKWKSFFKRFPFLRVLHLGEVEVGKLPRDIEKLFHLRYLWVKPSKNIGVPKSIFNLWNLQTLDLRTIRFSALPNGIWKMQQLRHLYLNGNGGSRLPKPEREDWILPNLQTLSYISIDLDDDINISEKAPNLRKLGLCGFRCFPVSEQHVTFNFPPHLHSLTFAEECAFEKPIKLPNSIAKITVKGVHLEQNIIKMFGKLPNLQILKFIETSFDDGELFFGKSSFPQLQVLKFEASNIETWTLKEGAIPNLHHLVISKCLQLTEPPSELQKVSTLQELELYWVSLRLAKKLHEDLKENKGLKLLVHSIISA